MKTEPTLEQYRDYVASRTYQRQALNDGYCPWLFSLIKTKLKTKFRAQADAKVMAFVHEEKERLEMRNKRREGCLKG